eukprot:8773698-Karenia_brevis.AAC.1
MPHDVHMHLILSNMLCTFVGPTGLGHNFWKAKVENIDMVGQSHCYALLLDVALWNLIVSAPDK